jgi:hypothetical protein
MCHSLYGVPILDIVLQIKEFMNKNRKEITVFEFTSRSCVKNHQKLIDMIREHLGNVLADSSKGFQTIEEMVQKNERLVLFYNRAEFSHGNIWNRKFIDARWGATNQHEVLMSRMLDVTKKFSGNPQRFFIPQWVTTPQQEDIVASVLFTLNLPGQSKAIEGIPRFMFPVNQNFVKFIKMTQKFRINSLYLDVYHNLDIVSLARLLNDDCNDSKEFRESKPGNCRDLESKGRCNNPDDFMKIHCKRTCGLCKEIHGFSGDSCENHTDCILGKCKISKKICLTNKPKRVGEECGVDYQCETGRCNPILLKCERKFIDEECEKNSDCQSLQCERKVCVGEKKYHWIGTSPLCSGYPDGCHLKSLSHTPSSYSSSFCGDSGGWCYTGHKVLCSNFIQKVPTIETFWIPFDRNDDKCNVIPSDCLRYNGTFLLKTKCGNSNVVCQNPEKFKILCKK